MSTTEPESIKLPPPSQTGDMSLEKAIAGRRSVRRFTAEPVSRTQLSQILWAAQGITDSLLKHRTIPSAGATYPLELFIVCGGGGINAIDDGIYHYHAHNHSLTLHHEGDIRPELAGAALGEKAIHKAPVALVICALYERTAERYGARAERYIHMEAGHAGQNIYLQATVLGLATVAVGAFNDERVGEVLRLEEQYKPLYIMPLGREA